MALTTPSASPAVTVRELDLTGVAPNVQTSTGAIAGNFKWGPMEERVFVSDENTLVSTFGSPSNDTAVDFLSAAYFLKYSGSLYVVRGNTVSDSAATPTTNASNGIQVLVKNRSHWEDVVSQNLTDVNTFVAKYPGAMGNSIKVSVCGPIRFSAWSYQSLFDTEPAADEMHIVVEDTTGAILGSPGVLETFGYVSTTKGAKTVHGSNNYFADVLNTRSQFVWATEFDLAASSTVVVVDSAGVESTITLSGDDRSFMLSGGTDPDTANAPMDFDTAYDLFKDVDNVTIDFLIGAQGSSASKLIEIANGRRDCVAVFSPDRDSVVGNPNPASAISSWASSLAAARSTYAVVDGNFLKVYDKYNDKYAFIPAASSTAGIMAATDTVAAPWYSPAGDRRGNYLGITDIAFNPSKSERDAMYRVGVNPIANIPGSGVLLYGDKTFVTRPTAFDRINVRRLFLAIERSIALAGKNVMFEFNDEFTRAEFVNIVEPLLREIKGRRGIAEFRVVCDETNNTAAVIDRNEFVASIFIKPARSINYVTLNFVAVRTGVEFSEVVGLA